jgi:hypothetical protein
MMTHEIYRYEFPSAVAMEDVESSIVLALLAAQGLHGEALVRLEARHHLDIAGRRCVVDASSAAGHDFNRIFASFLLREFGDAGFKVERVNTDPSPAASRQS